jgi:transposase
MSKSRKGGTSSSSKRERRAFTDEFKQEAVRLVHDRRSAGGTLTQVARELDVRADVLRSWVAKYTARTESGAPVGGVETPEQELRRLRRENATLRQEREFAKKVAAYFAKESR